ncbi:MAG TPA: recombination protein RecR [Bacteroidales bacterium]|nr:recombination protein RecR [Bacteroidales bacterium]
MTFFDYPSKLLENAVNEFASLPGIGKKTAFRLVMHLLRQSESDVERFGENIVKLKKEVKYCKNCFNISDNDICDICSDKSRDRTIVCIVENISDVIAIENTRQYRGLYHVLGGIISPMDGIGPSDLNIDQLEEKVKKGGIEEVIFALSATMEGDTTNYYIYKRLLQYNIRITSLSRGVAIGDELEYTDEITLGRSIINRTPFDNQK